MYLTIEYDIMELFSIELHLWLKVLVSLHRTFKICYCRAAQNFLSPSVRTSNLALIQKDLILIAILLKKYSIESENCIQKGSGKKKGLLIVRLIGSSVFPALKKVFITLYKIQNIVRQINCIFQTRSQYGRLATSVNQRNSFSISCKQFTHLWKHIFRSLQNWLGSVP